MDRRNVLRSVASTVAGAGGLTGGLVAAEAAGSRSGSSPEKMGSPPLVETADGTRLFYKDWGTGAPLVFVHGGQLGADMWEYQMTPLVGEGLRCIAYDRRGCGRSSQPGHGYDVDTLADDLAALLAQLDLRGVTLVGHSNGCGDIARYLSRHGADRVARAVLVAPTTPFLLKTADNPNGLDMNVFEATIAELINDRPRFLTSFAPIFFSVGLPGVAVSPELAQWGVELALQASPLATIAMTRTFAETDFRPDMRAFTMPTLVIHPAGDQVAPLELCGRRTARAIAGSRLEVYDTGHGLFITEKERLNRELLDFVRG
jgi:pimeloyl-ACP methyl ester carboxylesterase